MFPWLGGSDGKSSEGKQQTSASGFEYAPVSVDDIADNNGMPVAVAVPINNNDDEEEQQERPPPVNPSFEESTVSRPSTTTVMPSYQSSAPPVTLIVTQQQQSQPQPQQSMVQPRFLLLGRRPTVLTICPNCHGHNVRTRIHTYPTCKTWIAVGLIAVAFWPLCWLPLVVDTCKQTDHVCLTCQQVIGILHTGQDCCVKMRR